MARKAREKSSTGIYAVTLRCFDEIFKIKDVTESFEELAQKYLDSGLLGMRMFPNRADMLIKESENGISRDMKPFTTSFARTYNREFNGDGKVFKDRFASTPVETEELKAECINYLEGKGESVVFKADNKASAAKVKSPEKKKIVKPQEKKQKKTETVKEPEIKKTEPEVKPQKPKKKNLPSWLL